MAVPQMRDPYEVLQKKEQELIRVKKEVDALRVVAKLLGDENSEHEEKIDLKRVIDMP